MVIELHEAFQLNGKRVLITGGTTGVGRATALLLARQGCRVFICGRDAAHLEDALGEIKGGGGMAEGMAGDVGTEEGIASIFAAADAWLGGLDIAVLNAGIGAKGELTEMSHAECARVVSVNLLSCISCAKEAMHRMAGRRGDIVMTGSMSAEVADERSAVYVATKAGVRGFAASLRKEANPLGVRVSLVEPGSIGSDMVDETPERQREMNAGGLMLRAEDVARAILFMLVQPDWCDVIKLQIRPHLQLI
ncbi:MAG: SDR family oxidoreductase [Verrucomicrobiota bacterium]